MHPTGMLTSYRPQQSCGKVMFLHLSVSHSVHRGVNIPLGRHTPPGQTPPRADTPPAQRMLGYGQQTGGTHPVGMHTCSPESLYLSMKF